MNMNASITAGNRRTIEFLTANSNFPMERNICDGFKFIADEDKNVVLIDEKNSITFDRTSRELEINLTEPTKHQIRANRMANQIKNWYLTEELPSYSSETGRSTSEMISLKA